MELSIDNTQFLKCQVLKHKLSILPLNIPATDVTPLSLRLHHKSGTISAHRIKIQICLLRLISF